MRERIHGAKAEPYDYRLSASAEMIKAFEALETALEARSAGLIYCHVDPAYDTLWGDPRFDDIAARIGLKREA